MSYYFTPFPVLETERLTLRSLNLEDTKAIFSLRTNRQVNKFITRNTPKNLAETKAFIDMISSLVADNKGVLWGLESKQNNELIGTIGLRNFDVADNYAEIGYELNPDYQDEGYMSEAMKTILEFGKTTMNLKTIEGFTHENNTASIALLEKHNFVFQPERRDEGFENNRIWKFEVCRNHKV